MLGSCKNWKLYQPRFMCWKKFKNRYTSWVFINISQTCELYKCHWFVKFLPVFRPLLIFSVLSETVSDKWKCTYNFWKCTYFSLIRTKNDFFTSYFLSENRFHQFSDTSFYPIQFWHGFIYGFLSDSIQNWSRILHVVSDSSFG